MRWTGVFALCALATTVAAAGVHGQACVGGPVSEQGESLAPSLQVQPTALSDIRTYGADATVNPAGMLALDAGYGYSRFYDSRSHTLRARPSVEVRHGPASICVFGGAQVTRRRDEFDVMAGTPLTALYRSTATTRQWLFPLGAGVGLSRSIAPSTSVSLYADPEVLFIRTDGSLDPDPQAFRIPVMRTNELGFEGGVRIRHHQMFAGVSYMHTTWWLLPKAWTFSVGLIHGH